MTLFPENEFLVPKANGVTLNETSGFYRRTRNALAVSATYLYRRLCHKFCLSKSLVTDYSRFNFGSKIDLKLDKTD